MLAFSIVLQPYIVLIFENIIGNAQNKCIKYGNSSLKFPVWSSDTIIIGFSCHGCYLIILFISVFFYFSVQAGYELDEVSLQYGELGGLWGKSRVQWGRCTG